MAGFAINLGDVIRMWILLDVGVAVVALQVSMHAGAELVGIDRDAVSVCVLHRLVAVTCQAIRLRGQPVGHNYQDKGQDAERDGPATSAGLEQGQQALSRAHNNSNDE